MPEALCLTKIRVNRSYEGGTYSGLLRSPTAEDRKTPPVKNSLKKSVSFNKTIVLHEEKGVKLMVRDET
jgi:hypothetical protein